MAATRRKLGDLPLQQSRTGPEHGGRIGEIGRRGRLLAGEVSRRGGRNGVGDPLRDAKRDPLRDAQRGPLQDPEGHRDRCAKRHPLRDPEGHRDRCAKRDHPIAPAALPMTGGAVLREERLPFLQCRVGRRRPPLVGHQVPHLRVAQAARRRVEAQRLPGLGRRAGDEVLARSEPFRHLNTQALSPFCRWPNAGQGRGRVRRIDIDPKAFVQRLHDFGRRRLTAGNLDDAAHTPVIGTAPTGAVKGVRAGLVEGQRRLHNLARWQVDRGGVASTDGETVDDVVGDQAQLERGTDDGAERARKPAAGFTDPTVNRHRRRGTVGPPPGHGHCQRHCQSHQPQGDAGEVLGTQATKTHSSPAVTRKEKPHTGIAIRTPPARSSATART